MYLLVQYLGGRVTVPSCTNRFPVQPTDACMLLGIGCKNYNLMAFHVSSKHMTHAYFT